jgi:protein-tyrosine phosphatase
MALILVAADDGAHCDEILPRLFISNAAFAQKRELLFAKGITHVVTAAVSDGVGALFQDSITYYELDVVDSRDAPLAALLPASSAFIARALEDPCAAVLVHCKVGISRSVTVLLHFLLTQRDYTLRGALLHIMHVRAGNARAPYTHPNVGFMWSLIEAEEALRRPDGATMTLKQYVRHFSTGNNFDRDPTVPTED